MSLISPIEPIHFDQRWFYPRLLPKASVVLLDGATGVGKSMFCAHLASKFSHAFKGEKRNLTLFVTSRDQTIPLQRHLGHQQVNADLVARARFYDCYQFLKQSSSGEPKNTILDAFQAWLSKLLGETRPLILVLDDFEEMVQEINEQLPRQLQGEWWRILRSLSIEFCCTIIATRKKGMNIARHYGHFNTTGTEYTDFILTMHWHPHDPKKRVISVAKNNHGPIGMQWHFHFDALGATSLHEMEEHQHVRPSKVPQTWKADPGLVNRINKVAEDIKEYMGDQDKPIQEMREHLKSKEYSMRVIDHTIGLMGITHTKVGDTWCYQPTQTMWIAARTRNSLGLRTHSAPLDAEATPGLNESEVEPEPRTRSAEDETPPTPSTLRSELEPELAA